MLSPSPTDVLTDLTAVEPPRGFAVVASQDGHPALTYRTEGLTGVAMFFALWLAGWTGVGGLFTYQMIFTARHFTIWQQLFMPLYWAVDLAVLNLVLWLFWSTTTITFRPDRLLVERRLHKRQKRQEISRSDIEGVWQIKDGGVGPDSFPSWGVVVAGKGKEIKLLERQKIEKSAWLGPIVARWAGVEYEEA